MDVLIVVDLQNDFITGSLGTKEAECILPRVVTKIKEFNGKVLYTRDTHDENYLTSLEGKKLPICHCIKNTDGWRLHKDIEKLRQEDAIDKKTFGSTKLPKIVSKLNEQEAISSITLIGLCTDICVISNALLLKAFFPEVEIIVDASCCAGVTKESHKQALEAMKVCQIQIVNEFS